MLSTAQLSKTLGVSVAVISQNTCKGALKVNRVSTRFNMYEEKDVAKWLLEKKVAMALKVVNKKELLEVVNQIIKDCEKGK